MDNKSASGGGIGICGVTFIVFLILKLCNIIDWSWWWVTAPLWIPIALCVAVCIVLFIVGVFIGIIRACIKLREERNGK
jgi:hypothetical protein